MNYFECCKDCVAPKRHVGCHSTCKEYLDGKAAHDEEQATIRQEKRNHSTINAKRKVGMEAYQRQVYKNN